MQIYFLKRQICLSFKKGWLSSFRELTGTSLCTKQLMKTIDTRPNSAAFIKTTMN